MPNALPRVILALAVLAGAAIAQTDADAEFVRDSYRKAEPSARARVVESMVRAAPAKAAWIVRNLSSIWPHEDQWIVAPALRVAPERETEILEAYGQAVAGDASDDELEALLAIPEDQITPEVLARMAAAMPEWFGDDADAESLLSVPPETTEKVFEGQTDDLSPTEIAGMATR